MNNKKKAGVALALIIGGIYMITKDSKRFKSYGVLNGISGDMQLKVYIALITKILGNGKNKVVDLFIQEIINAETQNGYFPDNALEYGEGIGQFDRIAFDDVKTRTRSRNKKKLKFIGIDVDNARYEDLRGNALLSIAFMRLKLLLVTAQIPIGKTERFKYYKRWYNSSTGKSNIAHWNNSQIMVA